jgi:predicted adenylyl cyclase CyaB
MAFINIEIKAATQRTENIRQFLQQHDAEFKGVDEQTDTYFNVSHGRLKLRQGKIENNLIHYTRPNQLGPKQSDFDLVKVEEGEALKGLLTKAMGVKIVVKKRREIYYIENVKFHLDSLEGLGNFVEIEAGNKTHPVSLEELHQQCDYYIKEFGIKDEDLIDKSYSDMLLELRLAKELA